MARVHATGWTLAVALAACQTEAKPLTESVVRILFDEFTTKHRPQQYGSEEDRESRFEIFNKNVQQIEMVNSQNLSYTLTINQFTDMSPLEFSRSHGFKKPKEGSQWKGAGVLGKHRAIPSLVAPQSVDWVSRGAVTPVKNQGQCGSCWSFSTTGALEGAFQIATGRLVSLSEQQLVDCDPEDSGCSGGIPEEGLQFEQKQGDICTEESYPYTAHDGSCQANGCSAGFHGSDIKGIREVDASEDALTQAVAGRPISIAIDAGPFQNYNGGVLSDCGGRGLDHAVLLVGYDGESWKVKNSWGPSWGESGYIRMMRQGANCLGLQNQAVYAIVAGSPSPSPSPTPSPSPSPSPNCKPSSLSFCCSKGTPCDCSRGSGAAGQCHWWSYEFCCKTGTPCHCASPSPSPSPTPTPTPTPVPSPSPAPGPGTSCEWNSDCPPGQKCYYPNESASSGICSSSPPFLNSGHRHGHDITV